MAAVRMVPATIVTLLVDTGRLRRPERAVAVAGLVRGLAALALAGSAMAGASLAAYGAVAVAGAAAALVRPTTLGLLPSVAITPEELVAGNAVFALGESVGTFAGPLLAGAAVAVAGPPAAAGVGAAASLLAGLVALGVHVAPAARPTPTSGPRARLPVVAALRELAAHRPAAAVMTSFFWQSAVRGALTTYLAILALDVLGLGDPGVGLLGATLGLGGIAGGLAALQVGRREKLAPVFVLSLVAWGLPLAVIGFVPLVAVALLAMAVIGIGNAALDVTGFTLLQRGTTNASRVAVFLFLELGASITVAAGGLIGSALVTVLGIQRALVLTGLSLPVVAVLLWPWVRRLDGTTVIPVARAKLLRGIPLFASLPLAALERVATDMRPVAYPAGATVMRQGESGDSYLVVASGRLGVDVDGEARPTVGPGGGVGEIALLRATPRTATVTADEPIEGFEIGCETFIAAVVGNPASAAAAELVVETRLGADHPG